MAVERVGAAVLALVAVVEPVGLPVEDLGRTGPDVDEGDLPAGLPAGHGEVAARHQRGAVGRDRDRLDTRLVPLAGNGEGDVDVAVESAAGRVDGGKAASRLAGNRCEVTGQEEPRAVHHEVLDRGADRHVEGGVERAVHRVDPDQFAGGGAVEGAELTSYEQRVVARRRRQRFDTPVPWVRSGLTSKSATNVSSTCVGGGVESEEPASGDDPALAGIAHLGERSADVDAVAHREDGVDLPVDDVGCGVGRIGRDHRVVGGVEGSARWGTRPQQQEYDSAGQGKPGTLGHGRPSVGGRVGRYWGFARYLLSGPFGLLHA